MKKFLNISLVLGLLVSSSFAVDTANKDTLVSIDSLTVLQKSKEGKVLAERLQKDIELFQNEVKNAQTKVASLQESIQKQAKVLSKEALMEKGEELANAKKRAERDLVDKEEALKIKVQREQTILRDKQLKVAKGVFDKNSGGMAIDVNTPGVLFVNKAIDKTDDVLKEVDAAYEKELLNKAKTVKAA